MAINFGFFRTPKHRVFNYQPLYYDERKEAMQERFERLHEQEQGKERDYKPGKAIRARFKRHFTTIAGNLVRLRLVGLLFFFRFWH